ncbi:hypothetical protein PHSY_000552 [Pseudozyma hubeiensis SY62]|uniref:Uncharacterized protein n=1 Tax=Pseudozyma hubeiensis (strain SY62) TaxID=1305764 RepID=R9NWW7_PSEHS|nr:hypothetical protein PHSY_000552 [Pseudozyma hubeiensis SY62]GAC92992.1 hypothetical protein PHSY_000552 [Pseudozyma hubeiensis SY62]
MGSQFSNLELGTDAPTPTQAPQPEAALFDPFIGVVEIYLSVPSDTFDTLQGLLSCIRYFVKLERDSSKEKGMVASACATLEVPGMKVHHIQTLAGRLPGFLWCEAQLRLRVGRQDAPPAYDHTDDRSRREELVDLPWIEALY